MKLTPKLLGYLSKVFAQGPGSALALRIRYDGTSMTWSVSDAVLKTALVGGTGTPLHINLAAYTIGSLAAHIAARPGYSVPFVATDEISSLSALTLLDATGDQDTSNGDHLSAYTSVLWAYLEAQSNELTLARAAATEALLQMSLRSASDLWVDEHGSYYGIERAPGETDAAYSLRVIASIGRPLGNNIAIEQAINTASGGLNARVTDAPAAAFTIPYAGTSYGLFDVVYSIMLDGNDDLAVYTERVRRLVEQVRDAGTHLRTISVRGDLMDAYPIETSVGESVNFGVSQEISESAALGTVLHNGVHLRDGSITYDSSAETLLLQVITAGVPGPVQDI